MFTILFFPASLTGQNNSNNNFKSSGQKNICLTMIVKNEEKIIERCLNNVKDLVDCISICDTGSTDNTVKIIEEYLKTSGIPGKVHQQKWQNFGYNRTHSVYAAQKTLAELGFYLSNTYLLLLDADMILKKESSFSKNDLKDESYLLIQKTPDMSYYNTRLIRASLPWECVGVTHEYWSCKVPHNGTPIATLWIDDQNDGGSKSDKYERDIRLLTQGLKDEPDNERYHFYLAQSYKCLKQYDDAIKWYKSRIDKGGWKEEIWYSKLMIAEIYDEMGQWDNALQWYLEAYQYHPGRAEPLQKISTHYRNNSQHNLACMFAKQGLRIPYPTDEILFISHPVYDYQFDEELSIAAFYTEDKDEGYEALNNLLLNKKVPYHVKEQAYKNLLFYVQNIQNATFIPISINLPLIREGSTLKYNPMNPSIQKTNKGYNLICRTVNYVQKGAKEFTVLDDNDPTKTIRTRNFLVQYDPNFNILSEREIIENLPRERIKNRPIEGLEDCRIFEYKNSSWFTCGSTDVNPTGQPSISLCKLSDKQTGKNVEVEKLVPFKGPDANRCEKNWGSFVKNNELLLLYSYNPFVIYKPNVQTGECETYLRYDPKHDFSYFRGSAAPIPFDNGYLMLAHEVVFKDQRFYTHRFLYADKDFNITKASKPFTFRHQGVEFCCSMTIDHTEKNLVMPIGIEDREAYLAIVDLNTIRSMLKLLPNFERK
ncbi:MAG: glycosyltransferase [Parachlamydiaceae bacterium]|nr:glycosyltransferase [Parachlamydiaceae bacterium]